MQNNTFSVEGLFDFLNAGVSAFHSTAAAVKILEENGYQNCPESAAWELVPGGRYYTTRNGSAVLAWRMPKGELTGWHVTASHSDSPTWRIKQLDGGKDAVFAKAETEGYGGMIMPTWLDRPLSVAGRILVRTENGIRSLLVHPDRALAVIPNLCIHFNHDLNNGMKYNPQVDLQPIFGEAGSTLRDALAEEAGVKAEDIVDADLVLCTREKAERVGLKGEYFMSGRIDDLECAYTTLWGFLQGRGEEEGRGDMWVMFDNEEVGSSSRQGAQGTLMANVLARIEEKLGVTREQSIRACTNSLLLSADNGHATHPNHPEKSDPANVAVMGGGVLLNQCPHQLDLWQWIFGMPNRVMGHCKYGHWHNIEVEDEVTAYAEYPNGATGAFITTTGECPGTNRLEITGDKGKLVWEEGKLTWWKLAVPEREFCVTCKEGFAQPEMTVTEVETDNIELGHNGILQNFTNAILYGEELLAPGYEGINGLNISNAIHLSDWTGKPQAVPVDGELFLKYLNERRATSHVKEEKEDSGKIADLSGTYNDRWKVR